MLTAQVWRKCVQFFSRYCVNARMHGCMDARNIMIVHREQLALFGLLQCLDSNVVLI